MYRSFVVSQYHTTNLTLADKIVIKVHHLFAGKIVGRAQALTAAFGNDRNVGGVANSYHSIICI